jgi:hypothetical protein
MQVPTPDLPFGLDLLAVFAIYPEGSETTRPTFWVLARWDLDERMAIYSMDEDGTCTLDQQLDRDGEPLPAAAVASSR